jgi:cyanophycinase-like exopeptidase
MTVLLPTFCFAAKPTTDNKNKVTYQYSSHGNADISNVKIKPMVVLSGGGTDVVEAFQKMCIASNGGDFLILGMSTFDKNYFSYIRNACVDAGKPANSVATLVIPDAAAATNDFVITTIKNAEAIWITGGDQSNYINYWSGDANSVQGALKQKVADGAVIGGISAGMNVLSEFVYTAQGTTTVTSTLALANPNSPSITVIRDFVEVEALHGLICDPHFVTRDRMGRDLAFLYRIYNHWGFVADGVGVDEATAVVIKQDAAGHWTADVLGTGKAYFLHPTILPSVIASGSPLDGVTVEVIRVGATGTFDLTHWAPISGGSLYQVTATAGSLKSDQSNPANVY